jgi:hypothetical protein
MSWIKQKDLSVLMSKKPVVLPTIDLSLVPPLNARQHGTLGHFFLQKKATRIASG